jgi:hypothetical protein
LRVANISQQIAQKTSQDKPEKTPAEIVPERYHKFLKVFNEKAANRFPPSRPWDHTIDLKEDFTPMDCKIYPLSTKEHNSQDTWINEDLAKGYIQPSKSPQASPVFFVEKKDKNELQPVQDYRKLSEGTIRNSSPLPLIGQLIDKLQGARYFTKMDVRWGFSNICIKDGDQWKAAFKTPIGLFKPMVMYFGLCNSPATFQTMMNHLFKDLINRDVVVVYMDNILIFTQDQEEHRQVTKEVLQILKDNNLYLKPKKCEFEKEKIKYLGLVI